MITTLGALLGFGVYAYVILTLPEKEVLITKVDYALAAIIGAFCAPSVFFLNHKVNSVVSWRQNTGLRLLLGIIITAVTIILVVSFSTLVYGSFIDSSGNAFGSDINIKLRLTILIMILATVFSVIYFASYSYFVYAHERVNELKQRSRQIDLQLAALKTQLSPHFLFNSLNTIASIMHRDFDDAEQFIRNLANLFQKTLDAYKESLIPLSEEIALVRAYGYLLKTRFSNQINVDIDIPENLQGTLIPPLSLQLLVENAVKHNIMKVEDPLSIEIGANDSSVWVKNNLTDKPAHVESMHIGLSNVRARYKILANKPIKIVTTPDFIVKLPILR
jgi:ABC-type multidrug transport system fused ATPase/permease subunit